MSDTSRQLRRLLFSYAIKEEQRVRASGARFVYYTSAEVALSIVRDGQMWMRNASTMNDFREMQHGWECFTAAWRGDPGRHLQETLEKIAAGLSKRLEDELQRWWPHYRLNTYLTCVSEHDDSEDTNGRLSMWRAYGAGNGVALVFKDIPAVAEGLAAYMSPVFYAMADTFSLRLGELGSAMRAETALLQSCGADAVLSTLIDAMRFAILSTKHPGFSEEREWRVVYSPSVETSKYIQQTIHAVNGTPQRIYKIPLKDFPKAGLPGLAELLDKVIIGPTRFPGVVADAFHQSLQEAGIKNPAQRISVSGIPLRTG